MNTILTPRPTRAPLGAVLAIALVGSLSLLAWGVELVRSSRAPHRLLIVGDSTVANYRLPVGSRLQDALDRELGRGWATRSHAGAGTRPGDFYLQLHKAEMMGFDPDVVVIGFAPHKLTGTLLERFGFANQDLRYLPLDEEGYGLYRTLSPSLQNETLVEKLGLLFFFLDVLTPVWRDHVQWPFARARARRRDPVARAARIYEHAVREGDAVASMHLGTYEEYCRFEDVRDLEFFVGALRRRHETPILLLMPEAHTGIAETAFSPEARSKLARSYAYALRWAREHDVPVLDFNTPSELRAFPPDRWDDIWHLKSPESFAHIAHAIRAFLAAHSTGARHG